MIEIIAGTISTIFIIIITKIFDRYILLNKIMNVTHCEEFFKTLKLLDNNDQQSLKSKNRFKLFLYAIKTWYK